LIGEEPGVRSATTTEQLARYELSGGGTGIHWEDLAEDISVEGLLAGRGDLTTHRRVAA
jgi:hypothetical protein